MRILYQGIGFVLGKIFEITGSYGLSIIILTVVVKLLILPLTLKSLNSTKEMQKLQPKIDALNKKYANDKEKLSAKTMELYKENNVNPIGGCLPLLIQMPIIFALFGVLRDPVTNVFGGNTELATKATTQVFLWVRDFAQPDRLSNVLNMDFAKMLPGLLPIMASAFTYLQMAITPQQSTGSSTANSMNNSMKVVFPVMILMSGLSLSAGVALYWSVSTALQVLQQYIMYKDKNGGTN